MQVPLAASQNWVEVQHPLQPHWVSLDEHSATQEFATQIWLHPQGGLQV